MAPIAAGPANASNPSSSEINAANQTQYTGECVRLFTLYSTREKGRPPSRENANICREQVVSCNTRQKGEETSHNKTANHVPSHGKSIQYISLNMNDENEHVLLDDDDPCPEGECAFLTERVE